MARPEEPSDAEIDAEFLAIASRLGDDVDLTAPVAPEPQPRPSLTDRLAARRRWDAEHATEQSDEGEDLTLGGPRDYAPPEDDEGFLAPDPPIGRGEPLVRLAWVAGVGGLIALVLLLILWPQAPTLVWLALILASVLGFGALIWRLPHHRDPDDDDPGAVV